MNCIDCGKKLSKEKYTRCHSCSRKGRKHTKESKIKMSIAHKSKKLSDEHRKNISKSLEGNQRAKGNPPNKTSFRKGMISWCKGKKMCGRIPLMNRSGM